MAILKAPDNLLIPNINNFKIICRICLENSDSLQSIFCYHDKYNENDDTENLSLKIQAICKVKIESDEIYPDKICIRCRNLLLIAYYFKILSENSDKKLRDIVSKNVDNVKQETDWIPNSQKPTENISCHKKIDEVDESIITKIGDCLVKKATSDMKCEPDDSVILEGVTGNVQNNIQEDGEDALSCVGDIDCGSDRSPKNSDFKSEGKESKPIPLGIKIIPLDPNAKSKLKKNKKFKKRILSMNSFLNDDRGDHRVKNVRVVSEKILPLNESQVPLQKKHKPIRTPGLVVSEKVLPLIETSECEDMLLNESNATGCYECLKCAIQFENKAHLDKHMYEQHVNFKEYKCYGCDLVLKTSTDRIVHEMRRCSKLKPGSKYQCQDCNTTCNNRPEYDVHRSSKHKGPDLDTLQIDHLLKCPHCDYTTAKRTLLYAHIKYKHLTDNNYVCETCGKHYTNRNTFISHKKTHIPAVKLFKCKFCEYSTKYSTSLTSHQRTHTRECRYTCEQCGKSFITNGALHVHHKRHAGVREHQCNLCDKNYVRKCELVSHVESVHEKIRPYKCTVCDVAFYQKNKCQKHMTQVHKLATPPDIPTINKRKKAR